MPKREGGDALRPPLVAASRTKAGSSNATSARPGPYVLGGTFANSSSSLINNRGNAAGDSNLAAAISSTGPVVAAEAPHLSAAEAYFGRMTLTAPDNMKRKKAEEKEKKKQLRKRRAEKGAVAAATLLPSNNTEGAGPSAFHIERDSITPATTSTSGTDHSTRRRKKSVPTSSSTSNYQSYTIEQSRSRSPTRPPRPQSAQKRIVGGQPAGSDRRRPRLRDRTGSEGSIVEQPPRPHSASAAAPHYLDTGESQQGEPLQQHPVAPSQAELASLPTAAQRRRDIYADLDTLGLPGASDSDLEDMPPPFPLNATRPISPPQLPAEGEEWTEDLRRRQEAYEMNRPPDSPPPAFRSDDERGREEDLSADVSSSDEEGSMSFAVREERQKWEEDVTAGFTFEQRVERDRKRREGKEREVEQDATQVLTLSSGTALVVSGDLPKEEEEDDEQVKREGSVKAMQDPVNEPAEKADEVVEETSVNVGATAGRPGSFSDQRRSTGEEQADSDDVFVPALVEQARLEDVMTPREEILFSSQIVETTKEDVLRDSSAAPLPETIEDLSKASEAQVGVMNLGQLVREARARREHVTAAEETSVLSKGPLTGADVSQRRPNSSSSTTHPQIDSNVPLTSMKSAAMARAAAAKIPATTPAATTSAATTSAATTLPATAPAATSAATTSAATITAATTSAATTSAATTLPATAPAATSATTTSVATTTPATTSATRATRKTVTEVRSAAAKEGLGTSRKQEGQSKATKIRSRPSGEEQSRFRDGASAAANRRVALWGPFAAESTEASTRDRKSVALNTSDAVEGSPMTREEALSLTIQRQASSSSSSGNVFPTAHEADAESSSDSDHKWEKEEKAFKKMQKSLAPNLGAPDESSEEEDVKVLRRPGWYRSNSIDLAKPGASVPRAPPPLALGRSRGGGVEFSSSDSSSSESGAGRMDDSDDDSLSPIEAEEEEEDETLSEARSSSSMYGQASTKGKEAARSSLTGKRRSMPPIQVAAVPAGQFEEDSGSSHDFMTDEDVQTSRQERRGSDESVMRSAVSNRLLGLFSTQLNTTHAAVTQPSAVASRSSTERLFNTPLDLSRQSRAVSSASRRSSQGVVENDNSSSSKSVLVKQLSNASLRSQERANAYASLEAKDRSLTSDQQARLEALEQISRLQQGGSSTVSPGVNQDSLYALERLLSRRSVMPSDPSVRGSHEGLQRLTRSGAINRRESTAPFVNPRSSVAPRPFGRLPTITNATRHFPPSSQSSTSNAGDKSGDSSNLLTPSPHINSQAAPPRRGEIGTPSWLGYIPSNERRALPEPMEPVKKNMSAFPVSVTRGPPPAPPPPPLPSRQAGNRISAMIERFEVQSADANVILPSPRSPSKEAFDRPGLPLPTTDVVSREHSLRRRPPPPPPTTLQASSDRQGGLPSSLLAASAVGQEYETSRLPSLPPRPPSLLPSNDGAAAASSRAPVEHLRRSTAEQGTLESLPLPHRSSPTITSSRGESSALEPLAPRTRSRPLPIPPIFQSSAAQRIAQEQRQRESERLRADSAISLHLPESPVSHADDPATTPQEIAPNEPPPTTTTTTTARRAASLGYTDLDLFASRLADEAPADGTNYEDLHLLAEFLGPAKDKGATAAEIEALSVGVVEILRKRIVGKKENGKDKIKLVLNVMGVKVERCGVCLVQFKEGNLACLFPCLHVFHEECAAKLLRSTRLCPTCRIPIA
ncbi:hypothetical protein CBS101457_001985 [Exobasidium rhododendri]|nr:hypothetical protein CBS101457_001985 [Exobasidium rhododendri]